MPLLPPSMCMPPPSTPSAISHRPPLSHACSPQPTTRCIYASADDLHALINRSRYQEARRVPAQGPQGHKLCVPAARANRSPVAYGECSASASAAQRSQQPMQPTTANVLSVQVASPILGSSLHTRTPFVLHPASCRSCRSVSILQTTRPDRRSQGVDGQVTNILVHVNAPFDYLPLKWLLALVRTRPCSEISRQFKPPIQLAASAVWEELRAR